MTLFEILLLSIGALIFVVSFFIPDKGNKGGGHIGVSITEDEIKKMIAKELEDVKSQIVDMVDESVKYGMEKTERAMERVSNEKIMAVSEYSDTVLETIHKNHEEAVFLYDMLNDKHSHIKDTQAKVEQTSKEVKEIFDTKEVIIDTIKESAPKSSATKSRKSKAEAPKEDPRLELIRELEKQKAEKEAKKSTEEFVSFESNDFEQIIVAEPEENEDLETLVQMLGEESPKEEPVPEVKKNEPKIEFGIGEKRKSSENSNERILALHKLGKSNMAIAKELGLGIGEVNLVIGLFKG